MVDRTATKNPVLRLVYILAINSSSAKSPCRSSVAEKNQSRVNPFQGSEMKLESLNARTEMANRGMTKNAKNRKTYTP
jgi:hypothetical protein